MEREAMNGASLAQGQEDGDGASSCAVSGGIEYRLAFCPRYRRKIFAVPGVREEFTGLAEEALRGIGASAVSAECGEDYVYLEASCPPWISAADAVRTVKAATGKAIRNRFPELSGMPGLWTRSYFAATAETRAERGIKDLVSKFVEGQRKRY